MKKKVTILLIILFSLEIDQAGNSFNAQNANDIFSTAEGHSIKPNNPTVYSPEDVGMSSITLARIDSIVNNGIEAKAFPGCQVLVIYLVVVAMNLLPK